VTPRDRKIKGEWERRDSDFYPTPADATLAVLQAIGIPNLRVWEPACGDGSMADVLKRRGNWVKATDLRHTGYGTGGVDFLDTHGLSWDVDAIITNPPFDLAWPFVQRALATGVPIIAMLLKDDFWSASTRSYLFRCNARPHMVCPLTWRPAFLEGERGKNPRMNVQWTVWLPGVADKTEFRPLARDRTADHKWSEEVLRSKIQFEIEKNVRLRAALEKEP
jgi:hypothetical protein